MGDRTLPVMREESWESFQDAAKTVERTAHRFIAQGQKEHAWMQSKDWHAGESLLATGRILLWRNQTEALLGTLVVSDRRFCFLPYDGSDNGRIEWDVCGVEVVKRDEIDPFHLMVREGKKEILITPVEGEAFIEGIREAVTESKNLGLSSSLDSGQPVPAVIGESCSVKLFLAGEFIKEIPKGQILGLSEDNSLIGLVYPGLPTSAIEEKPTLRVEVRRWDAIYQFDADVSGIHRCPKYIEEQLGRSAFVIVFYAPLDIRRFNRREAFRVKLVNELNVSLERGNDGGSVEATMMDVSTAGCALMADKLLQKDEGVELSFRTGSTQLSVSAVVKNCSATGDEEQPWRYGLRFSGVGADELEELQNFVMRCQRDLLADVADRRIFL
jgi:c-di-GMP-binding flagellar brake protein YcgR